MRLGRKGTILLTLSALVVLSICLIYFIPSSPTFRGFVRVSITPCPKALAKTAFQEAAVHHFRLQQAGPRPGLFLITVESGTAEGAKQQGEIAAGLLREAALKKTPTTEFLVVDSFERRLRPLAKPLEFLSRIIDPILKVL